MLSSRQSREETPPARKGLRGQGGRMKIGAGGYLFGKAISAGEMEGLLRTPLL